MFTCLCEGDHDRYQELKQSAQALGAAYQKVNFLRDIREDYQQLGRIYFPGVRFETFSAQDRDRIVADIRADFDRAAPGVKHLPSSCRGAVETSYRYYRELLDRLAATPVEAIKTHRIRLPGAKKLSYFVEAYAKQRVRR